MSCTVGQQGDAFVRVTLDFVVDENGCVRQTRARDVQAQRGSPADIARPFIEALEQVRFRPGTRGGVPVAVRMTLPFTVRRN